MKLTLQHCRNEDIGHDERAGYWTPPASPKKMVVDVASPKHASIKLREWVRDNGLGGGNMARDCGTVRDESGAVVAQVSYNGRVWQPGKECVAGAEIVLA